MDITPGVVVEFLVHPPLRGGDRRSALQLLIALAELIADGRSVLRLGHFRDYAQSAELLVGDSFKQAVHPLLISDGVLCASELWP